METLVSRRLSRFLESKCLLSPYQFGFRAGKEIMQACGRLTDDVVQAFRQRQQVQAVALDIQAAYDTVWQVGLVEKMARLGIDRHLIEWTRGFLCDRVSVLEVGSAHLEVRPTCGVPQGSPASPILFLIYINDLLQKLGGVQRVNRQAFADDLFLWIVGVFRDGGAHPELIRALAMVEDWATQWLVKFSMKKCECILFREQNIRVARQFEVRLYGECLPHVTEIRYLGVWFDAHLTWHRQIMEATTRARARLWLLRRLGGRDWGLDPYMFLRLVRGAVLPMLYYGAQCWASVLCSSTKLAALDAVTATAARMAFRLERTTSVEASLVMAGLEPARQSVMRHLVRHLVRRYGEALRDDLASQASGRRATPLELGVTWFRRSVQGKFLADPSFPFRRRIIYEGIDRAIKAEWSRRWAASETGSALHEIVTTVGQAWMPRDASRGSRLDLLETARFITGHCHVGAFAVPWHVDEWAICPWCGDDFTREHILWECRGLSHERRAFLGEVESEEFESLGQFVLFYGLRIGRFLRAAGSLLVSRGASRGQTWLGTLFVECPGLQH